MVGSAIVRELKRQGYTNIITRTHAELNLIAIRGAVPGPKGSIVYLKDTVKTQPVKKGEGAGVSVNPQKASARVNPQKASARTK